MGGGSLYPVLILSTTWKISIKVLFKIYNETESHFKDTHREKGLSSKTPMLSKSMNVDI